MKEGFLKALGSLFTPALRRAYRNHLPILMYHGVVPRALEPECWHQLPVGNFRRQMAWLARHYQVLPLHDALARLTDGSLPPRALALSFDDGYRNNRELAAPVLARYGFSATIFAVTGYVGSRRLLWPDALYCAIAGSDARSLDASALGLGRLPILNQNDRASACEQCLERLKTLPAGRKTDQLNTLLAQLPEPGHPGPFRLLDWDDVAALQATGDFFFGAHTTRHDILSRLDDAEVDEEVRVSQREVTAHTGQESAVFAYPNGRAGDFDDRARRAVTRYGMRWALTTISGLNHRGTDPLALRRIAVGAQTPLHRFRLQVAGAGRLVAP